MATRRIRESSTIPARYKATYRSLLTEIRAVIKMNRTERWTDETLIENLATVLTWRIKERDRKRKN